MKKIIFKGCGTALATPFNENGINFEEFKKFIEFQIDSGVNSLIVCGTTGESATMSLKEKKEIIKFTVDVVNKRIPVIAGTGSNCTANCIELSKYSESVGVDGLLIVTPYYNKTTQRGLIAHYTKIAKNVNLPIIMYSVPSRTGLNIEPQTCFELSKIPNIVAIKEAGGNISNTIKIASLCKDNLNIYSGNDDQIVPILSIGGIGVISVLSNIYPHYVTQITNNFFENKIIESYNMQLQAVPLINKLFQETNPIPVKQALNLKGLDFGIPRLPLIEPSLDFKNELLEEMNKFER